MLSPQPFSYSGGQVLDQAGVAVPFEHGAAPALEHVGQAAGLHASTRLSINVRDHVRIFMSVFMCVWGQHRLWRVKCADKHVCTSTTAVRKGTYAARGPGRDNITGLMPRFAREQPPLLPNLHWAT
jgi:hypothetical protein